MAFTAEEVFALHPGIRFAGLATRKGQMVFSKMRPGVVSYHPEPTRTATIEIQGQYMIEMAEKKYWAGTLEHITVSFEKYVHLFIPLKKHIAEITLEKDVPPESYRKICSAIQALE
ncbi:MAG TPA: hypothetical protein VJZ03_02500 [Candidatus Bathyarchaeia archaeon]|nr:hypothetical protein [Candidatus Bathyarchaeia archaeon]